MVFAWLLPVRRSLQTAASIATAKTLPLIDKSPPVGPLTKLASKELLELIPVKVRRRLRPDLKPSQLRGVIKMSSKGLSPPAHMLNIDPLTVVPAKGCHPELSVPLRKTGGRNHHGKITVRHRGGGCKRRIRLLDQRRLGKGEFEIVRIEHDPNRSAKIALVRSLVSRRLSYILAWQGCESGMKFENDNLQLPGCTLPLAKIALGTTIHNVEMKPGFGGQLARSAGCKATFVGKDTQQGIASIKLPSGKIVRVPLQCRATIGVVSNAEWHLRTIGTAGRMRRLGRRPVVRGVAMNAVDHPHGGGKGGRSKGKPSQSIWGWICK